MPLFTPEEREATLRTIADLVREDDRIEGIVVVGSMAGEPDRWSDVDLAMVVAEDASVEGVAARWVDRLYEVLPVLHHFEVAFGDTLVRGLLLAGLLEVDLSFTPARSFSIWGPAEVIVDRTGSIAAASPDSSQPVGPDWPGATGFAWHDILHAGIAAKRGRLWQGLWYLERVRNRTMALGSERRGWYAEFFDYVDDLRPRSATPSRTRWSARWIGTPSSGHSGVATRAFLAELGRGDPGLAARLSAPLLEFVDSIESA